MCGSFWNMRRVRPFLLLALIGAALGSSCRRDPVAVIGDSAAGNIRVDGTVSFQSLEGGFWAIRVDNEVLYDPISDLSKDVQRVGLRVRIVARERKDMASVHMAGPLVEIVSIRRLP